MPHVLLSLLTATPLLQVPTTEATKAAAAAASVVGQGAANSPFTALLWLLVLALAAVACLLVYRFIWKDKPATAAELDALRTDLARLESAFAERKKSVDAERLTDKLKFESDLAAVAATLSRLADVADKQTTMIERVGWQGKEIERIDRETSKLHEDIKEIRKDIKDIFRAKP